MFVNFTPTHRSLGFRTLLKLNPYMLQLSAALFANHPTSSPLRPQKG